MPRLGHFPASPLVALEEFWASVPGFSATLHLVDETLREVLSENPSEVVREVSLYLVEAGGKRLRPALVLLSGAAAGGEAASMTRPAAAVEMLHIATLYHDDVIDGALSRRGWPSTNVLWGNRVSAMAGNYLVARAIGLFAEQGPKVLDTVNAAVAQVWHGQMRELEGIYHVDRTEQAYLQSISEKTASFYRLPCVLGAVAADASPEVASALESFGQLTGMAFQVVDDVLDLTSDQQALGKTTGSDLRAGVYTLPVIHAMASGPDHARLRAMLAQGTIDDATHREAMELVRASGGIPSALKRARECIDRALAELDRLPESRARDALGATATAIIERAELRSWNEQIA